MKYGQTYTGSLLHLTGVGGKSLCGRDLVRGQSKLLAGEKLCENCLEVEAIVRRWKRDQERENRKREAAEFEERERQRRQAAFEALMVGIQVGPPPPEQSDGNLLSPGHVRHRLGVYRGTGE